MRAYLGGFVWLQSWGPLYAILHRISLGEAAEKMAAAALMPGGDAGISLVAQAGIRAVAADVAVMSGYLSMSVPFLAAALAYGVGRATSLASSVLHVGQEAASAAAREGSTGNLSLGSTQLDTHRFATLEGRQVRTSAHVDTDRYTGYSPEGAAFTVAADGTAIADAGVATSRLPAAGIRLSESLASSHENRAAQSRTLGENFSAEAGLARTAAATDATAMVERHSRDVNVGTAHAHGVTESESLQAQDLSSHVDRLSEIGGITKDQAASLTAEASLGGGFGKVVRVGASGRASWRGQTIESEAFNRMQDYAEQHQVMDLWSQVSDASRRYSSATGESELASLDESFGANLTRMQRFEDRASASFQTSENWSAQASQVRAESQAIDRELGQPFFAWLSERPGGDGRPIGTGGAMRLATPQTPEEAETLREYAAEFVSERLPAPVGAGVASVPSRATYEDAREDLQDTQLPATGSAFEGWSQGARERAAQAEVPGDVDGSAAVSRGDTEAAMGGRTGERVERTRSTEAAVEDGREAVESERSQPMGQQVLEEVPLIGGWLAGRLYGTARNDAPDAPLGGAADRGRPARRSGAGIAVIVILEKSLALAHEVLVGGPDPQVGVFAGFGRPIQVLVVAGQVATRERGPVAVPQALPEGLHETRRNRPEHGGEPGRTDPVGAGLVRGGARERQHERSHDRQGGCAEYPRNAACRCRFRLGRFHGMDLQLGGHSGDSIPAWPDFRNPTGLAPDTARLRRLPARQRSGPYRTASMGRSGR